MEKKSDTYQIATDIQWEYAGDGIVRQIMGYDEHLMMVKVKFDQGAIGTLHQHPHGSPDCPRHYELHGSRPHHVLRISANPIIED